MWQNKNHIICWETISSLNEEEGILTVELDLESILNFREEFPVLEQM